VRFSGCHFLQLLSAAAPGHTYPYPMRHLKGGWTPWAGAALHKFKLPRQFPALAFTSHGCCLTLLHIYSLLHLPGAVPPPASRLTPAALLAFHHSWRNTHTFAGRGSTYHVESETALVWDVWAEPPVYLRRLRALGTCSPATDGRRRELSGLSRGTLNTLRGIAPLSAARLLLTPDAASKTSPCRQRCRHHYHSSAHFPV